MLLEGWMCSIRNKAASYSCTLPAWHWKERFYLNVPHRRHQSCTSLAEPAASASFGQAPDYCNLTYNPWQVVGCSLVLD